MGAMLVAKRKRDSQMVGSSASPTPASELDEKKKKYDSPIKLTAEFKDKLERVAKDLGLYPGALVEQEMDNFIRGENLRVLQKELEKARLEQR